MTPDGTGGDWQRRVDEERRTIRRVRFIADLTLALIRQESSLSLAGAWEMVSAARRSILSLVPDCERQYMMIYQPRFERAIAERWAVCDCSRPRC